MDFAVPIAYILRPHLPEGRSGYKGFSRIGTQEQPIYWAELAGPDLALPEVLK